MKVQMQVLSIGSGTLETGGEWANAHVLDSNQVEFDDGTRQEKGCKVAKIKVDSSNDNLVAKRFFRENFPATFTLEVDTSVKKGAMEVVIKDFLSNIKTA